MVKECLDYEVLIAHENIDEIYRQRARVSLDVEGAAKKYRVYLWQQTEQNLTDTNTCENICLVLAYIYHGYHGISSKARLIRTIHHRLLS